MNKFLSSVAISAMFITAAFAEGTFYQATSGQWTVTGYNGGPGQGADGSHFNTSCLAQTFWGDGSDLQLIQDLVDGELYIVFNNNAWNIEGPYETESDMTLNMYGRRGVESYKVKFVLVDKNTISIRGLEYKKFLPAFMNYNKMVFIMPGTVENAEVGLKGSSAAIEHMSRCIDNAPKNLDSFQNLGPKTDA